MWMREAKNVPSSVSVEMPHYCGAVLHRRSLNGIKSTGKGAERVELARWGSLLLASLPRTGWRPWVIRRKRPHSAFNSSQTVEVQDAFQGISRRLIGPQWVTAQRHK